MRRMILFLLLVVGVHAQDRGETIWKWSIASYTTANALDLASSVCLAGSPGVRETNPLMQNTGSTIAVKTAVVGVVMLAEWAVLRKNKRYRTLAVLNFAASALPVYAAEHNFRLR